MNYKIIAATICCLASTFLKQGICKESILRSCPGAHSYVITNVSVFDGKDSVILANQDLFVRDGVIKEISKTGLLSYEGYDTLEATNKYIMPGLIDAHVHIQSNGSAPWAKVKHDQTKVNEALLYCGVTTVFDLGGIASKSKKIRKKTKKGKYLAPDLFYSHIPMTIPGAHPIPASREALPFPLNKMVGKLIPTVNAPDEAEKVVKKYVRKGVDYVKIICDQLPPGSPQMSFDVLKAIIDAVHSHNLKAVVHVGSVDNAINSIKAGADVLAHGIYRGSLTQEQAKFIAESEIPIVYTLFAFEFNVMMVQGKYVPNHYDSLLLDEVILEGISGKNGLKTEHSHVIHSFTSNLVKEKENWKNNFNLLRKNGAKIIVGTDAGTPGFSHGPSIYHEIDILIEYGMSTFEVLNAATYLSSITYLDKPKFGLIKKGYQADLLLLGNNPLKEINAVKEPELIITNGKMINRK